MVPEALFNTTIRPLPSDRGSWLKIPAFIENIVLFFGLLLITLFARRKLNKRIKRLVWSLFVFAFLVFVVVGWTTPVLGAIVRYKVPAVLALGIVGLLLIDFYKIQKMFGREKNR
jgi:predicted cation transporter